MRESQVGQKLTTFLAERGIKMFKLHNDQMQRGLPDYLLWGTDRIPVAFFELKKANTPREAQDALSSHQLSVLKSISKSTTLVMVGYVGRSVDRFSTWGLADVSSMGYLTVNASGLSSTYDLAIAALGNAMLANLEASRRSVT